MLRQVKQNQLPLSYVLNDVWLASSENMMFVKCDLERDFVMPLKTNLKVTLSLEDKKQGRYERIVELHIELNTVMAIQLEGVGFALRLVKQGFTNGDSSIFILYPVTSDFNLSFDEITTIYGQRWNVLYHKALEHNASLAKSPTKTATTQSNHFSASVCAYRRLEVLKVATNTNHFALGANLYAYALQSAFQTLDALHPIRLAA